MRLKNAARYFDRLTAYDGYSGVAAFKAQFDLFDDSKRDAAGVMRRILSTADGVTIPARRVIECPVGSHWIVGEDPHLDTFDEYVIRRKYILQAANKLTYIRTPGQVLAGSGGIAAYAGYAWAKDWKENEYGSKTFPYYEAYFSRSEAVAPGAYLVTGTNLYRVRSVYDSEGGFRVAESDELGAAVKTLSITGPGVLNPVTDTITAPVPTVAPGIVMRFTANFEYQQESAIKRQEGDLVVLVTKLSFPTLKVGDKVDDGVIDYTVLAIASEADCWRLHCRP